MLLLIIYIAFISLGLPDSLLGSGWPSMYEGLGAKISYLGIITMIISIGTIISSLFSSKLTKCIGSGKLTALSVLLTAVSMFGFSISNQFWQIVLLSVPYGLGAGGVDATLNNYVALHFSSKHMSWLHCFWGVGASLSPYIMGFCLTKNLGWNSGYRIVSIIQIVLTIFLFISLPLWKNNSEIENNNINNKVVSIKNIFKIKGVIICFIMFFTYCALEQTSMIWASSFLAKVKNINENKVASLASLIFLGITFGRFISGFISEKLGDKLLIKIGCILSMVGIILIIIPINIIVMIGLFLIGLGCAPIYPSIIHSTPINFGKENSQSIIGIQMAFAYMGTTIMLLVFGFLTNYLTLNLYPYCLLTLNILLFILSEVLNKKLSLKTEINNENNKDIEK